MNPSVPTKDCAFGHIRHQADVGQLGHAIDEDDVRGFLRPVMSPCSANDQREVQRDSQRDAFLDRSRPGVESPRRGSWEVTTGVLELME